MEKKTRPWIIFILALFCIVGLYTRLNGTFKGYFAFTFDQGRDFLAWEDYSHGIFSLIGPTTGIDGVFHGVWWHWFILPLFLLSGGNPLLVVSGFTLFVSSIILFSFWLGKKLANDRFGLVLAGLVTASPFFIGIAAQLWHPNVVPLLLILLLLAILHYLQTGKRFWLIGFLLGAIFEFEVGSGGLFLPAFIAALLITKTIPKLRDAIFAIGTFVFWLLPRLAFETRHGFIQTKSFFNYLQNPPTAFHVPLTERLNDRIQTAARLFQNSFAPHAIVGFGLFLLIVVSMFWFYRQKKHSVVTKKFFTILLVTLVLQIVVAAFYPNALWSYYLIGLPVFLLPIVGYGLYKIINLKPVFGWIVFGILLVFLVSPWRWFAPAWEGDASVYKNQLEVVQTIFQDAAGREFNVQVYSPSVIDYTYHYLFDWYGKEHYNYSPPRDESRGLVYLVIEPDKYHPVLAEAWLRDRVGDGVVVWEKKLPGNITVVKKQR